MNRLYRTPVSSGLDDTKWQCDLTINNDLADTHVWQVTRPKAQDPPEPTTFAIFRQHGRRDSRQTTNNRVVRKLRRTSKQYVVGRSLNITKNSNKLYRMTSLFVAISLILINVSWAASPGSTLKKLRKRYKQISTIQTEFKEVFEWEMTGETNISAGSMIVAEDNRFRIDTPEQLLVCDGTDIYRYNKVRDQLIIESVANASKNALPRRLLLDFTDGFKAVKLMPIAVNDQPGFRMDLVAEDPEKTMLKAAVLWVTEEDMTLHRLKLIDLSGNATTYVLSSIVFNKSIDANLTDFEPQEGTEIFDLR